MRVCKRDGCRLVLADGQTCPSVRHLDAANWGKPASHLSPKSSMAARHAANTRCPMCREHGGCYLSACSCDCHRGAGLGAKAPRLGIPLSVKNFVRG